jgi:type I restriction enzyme S subunit
MPEWYETNFADFVDINPKVSLVKDVAYSFVEMADLEPNNKFCEPSQNRVLSGGMRFQNGDTLFARITPCLENGKICQVRNLEGGVGFGSTEFHVLRGKSKVSDTDFIYYLSRWSEVRDFAELNLHGTSGRQRMPHDAFKELQIIIPSLPEQRAIAEVLSSLDDKIDLLHRNNKTLEEMAEVIYLHACNDSQLCNLGDWIEILDNKRVPLSSIQREKMKSGQLYPYYGAATVMDYVNEYIFDGDYLLMGEDGTVQNEEGYPILQRAVGKSWVNNHTHVLSAVKPLNNDLLEVLLRKTNIGHIVTGAVQPKINQTSLKSLEIALPKSGLENLAEQVKMLLDKRLCNRNQIQNLSEIRDNLLPKLMSGQVRVKDL